MMKTSSWVLYIGKRLQLVRLHKSPSQNSSKYALPKRRENETEKIWELLWNGPPRLTYNRFSLAIKLDVVTDTHNLKYPDVRRIGGN